MFGIRTNRPSPAPALFASGLRIVLFAASAVIISACGSGGGSGDNQGGDKVKKETISLDHFTNAELQRSASSGSKQMQSGMNNAQNFATQPVLADSVNTSNLAQLQSLLGMSGSDSSDTTTSLFGSSDDEVIAYPEMSESTEHTNTGSLWDDTGVGQLIDATLGLVGNADVTRQGNSMTIDPDDYELCSQDEFDMQNGNDLQFCLDMVSDLLVRIDGQTENSGNISYLFQEETVLQIEYAPGQTRFKLRLPGVHTVVEKAAQLAPENIGSLPQVFEGVIELGSRVNNVAEGSEAGAMDIAITAPIRIQDDAGGINIQVAATDLLRFEHDNALGTATVELDSSAFLYSFSDGQIVEFAGSGGTIKVDLFNDGEQISVSKLGLGNGPLTLTIDSVEVMRMTLDTFGFDIDTIDQRLVLNDGLNFNLMVNLFGGLLDDAQSDGSMIIEASVTAPESAQFSEQANGSIRLDNAGPFVLDWFASFGAESSTASFAVAPGECFTEGSDGNALFSQVVCP